MTYLNTFTELLYWTEYYYHRRAVIAGGAVRDMIWGKRPKDYDVFLLSLHLLVKTPMHKEVATAVQQLLYMKNSTVLAKTMSKSKLYAVQFGVSNWRYGSRKVQIIEHGASTLEALIEQFDWKICQCSYSLRDGLQCMYEPDDIHDLKLTPHTLTQLSDGTFSQYQANNSLRRGRKFAKKFGLPIDPEHEKMLIGAGQGGKKTV